MPLDMILDLGLGLHYILFCFCIPQDPSRVLCGRDAREFLIKCDQNTANDGASAKASPFHALIVLGKNDCPYWLVV